MVNKADMVLESGMNAYLDCWGVDAILDAGGAARGAVFESKSGRQAILADIVVDASGDGDIYAAAGAAFEKVKDNIGLDSRIGNIEIEDMTGDNRELMSGNREKSKGGHRLRFVGGEGRGRARRKCAAATARRQQGKIIYRFMSALRQLRARLPIKYYFFRFWPGWSGRGVGAHRQL
jgi:hypothetical protein